MAALNYFAAITDGPRTLQRVVDLIDAAGPHASPPAGRVLATPVVLGARSLAAFHQLQEERGVRVCFDSGGYYVQIGRIPYEDLYLRLLDRYRANPWADCFVLPDNVPTSRDTQDEVWGKVRQTVRWSQMFFTELPSAMQERAMPVVHGHTLEQVDFALSSYIEMGVRQIGFGSFGTFGAKSSVNIAHASSVQIAQWVVRAAAHFGLPVHLFGLGVPALVAMIAGLGARSFDSSGWLKAAGFGQVTLPFSRAYNITHRNSRSPLQRGILWSEFVANRDRTRHHCLYCDRWETLMESKWHRAAHNLICLNESIEMINQGNFRRIHEIYQGGSPKYRQEAARWLPSV
ncbi:MAG: hypothetical protein U0V87_18605 [Acidobacteriota bacterium]